MAAPRLLKVPTVLLNNTTVMDHQDQGMDLLKGCTMASNLAMGVHHLAPTGADMEVDMVGDRDEGMGLRRGFVRGC